MFNAKYKTRIKELEAIIRSMESDIKKMKEQYMGQTVLNKALKTENAKLQSRLAQKLEKASVPKLIQVDYFVDDPSPSDTEARKEYVGRTAGFFKDVLEPKLQHMISILQKELSNPMASRETDLFTKATINAFSLLLDWGDEMVGEQLENLKNNGK